MKKNFAICLLILLLIIVFVNYLDVKKRNDDLIDFNDQLSRYIEELTKKYDYEIQKKYWIYIKNIV